MYKIARMTLKVSAIVTVVFMALTVLLWPISGCYLPPTLFILVVSIPLMLLSLVVVVILKLLNKDVDEEDEY